MRIFDPNGVWLKNNSQFLMHNPETNQVYPSNEPIKVTDSKWIDTQPVLVRIEDPEKPPAAEKPKASAKPLGKV